ncbi:MAG: 23S rRNA (guanosine(2251)-2'-O)-methyltransferase RlmB [Actinomycetota bacterium]
MLARLRAGARAVSAVYLSRATKTDSVLEEIEQRAGARVKSVSPERLDQLARSDVHQGVVATAAPLVSANLDALVSDPRAFVIVLDGVTDPRNLGAVMRSAETAGATGVVLARNRSARVTPVVTKAAAGAIEYLPIALVGGIPAALERAKRAGTWCVGLDERGEQDVFGLALAREPIALVLGAEGRGLARLTRDRCDVLVRIPMHGHVASLNVAAAATLACHEIARRRDM